MVQRGADYSALQLAVEGYTKVMPHHKRKEYRARRFAMLGDIDGDRQRDCGNSSFFNSALNQRDGLMSYRSSRTKQDRLRPIRGHRIPKVLG